MSKYHIDDNGNPKPCSAKIKCPKGDNSPHFSGNLKEATKWAETHNAKEYSSFNSMKKSKNNTKVGKYTVPEKHKEIFQMAYDTVHENFDESLGLGKDFSDKTLDYIHDYMMRTDNIICSRTRAVFINDDHVIKIPITDEGMYASSSEKRASDMYEKDPENYIPIAKTELIDDGEIFYVKMEKVEPLLEVDYKKLPSWVGMVDGGQVGYTKDNVLVAYDL